MSEAMKDFAEKARNDVQEALGDVYAVTVQEVTKNNGLKLTGLSIRKEGRNISPIIYLDGYFKAGKADVAEDVLSLLAETPKVPDGFSDIRDLEKVQDRICFKLVNRKRNADRLEGMPHKDFLDLAIVFFVPVDMEGENIASVAVNNELASAWGLDADGLWELAKGNTERLFPESVSSMADFMAGLLGTGHGAEAGVPMTIVTNERKWNGAGVILYSGVLERISENIGKDLFILPSSVHEAIIIPDDGSSDEAALAEMVREINWTQVAEDEVLSDSVYRYSAGGDIEIAYGGDADE